MIKVITRRGESCPQYLSVSSSYLHHASVMPWTLCMMILLQAKCQADYICASHNDISNKDFKAKYRSL